MKKYNVNKINVMCLHLRVIKEKTADLLKTEKYITFQRNPPTICLK